MGIEVIALGVVIIILGLVIFRALRGDNREAPVAHQPKDDSKIEKPTPSERDNDNRGSTLTGAATAIVRDVLPSNVALVSNNDGKIALSSLSLNNLQGVIVGGVTTVTNTNLTPSYLQRDPN